MMFDMETGVHVIKGCGFKISSSTTMAEVHRLADQYIKSVYVTDNGYQHVTLMCNSVLNYEAENDIVLCFYGDQKIQSIEVHPTNDSIPDILKCKDDIAKKCRGWLKQNGQSMDHQIYDWGSVGYIEDMERNCFIGIRILFRCPFYQKLFDVWDEHYGGALCE